MNEVYPRELARQELRLAAAKVDSDITSGGSMSIQNALDYGYPRSVKKLEKELAFRMLCDYLEIRRSLESLALWDAGKTRKQIASALYGASFAALPTAQKRKALRWLKGYF